MAQYYTGSGLILYLVWGAGTVVIKDLIFKL